MSQVEVTLKIKQQVPIDCPDGLEGCAVAHYKCQEFELHLTKLNTMEEWDTPLGSLIEEATSGNPANAAPVPTLETSGENTK